MPVVAEYAPTGREPDGGNKDRQAAYWVQVNSGRWHQALQLEKQNRIVLCDSDPLKLHYSWCLAIRTPREVKSPSTSLISRRYAYKAGDAVSGSC